MDDMSALGRTRMMYFTCAAQAPVTVRMTNWKRRALHHGSVAVAADTDETASAVATRDTGELTFFLYGRVSLA